MKLGRQEIAFVGSTQDVVDGNHAPRCVVARWITLRPDESVGTNLVRAFQCTKDPEVGGTSAFGVSHG